MSARPVEAVGAGAFGARPVAGPGADRRGRSFVGTGRDRPVDRAARSGPTRCCSRRCWRPGGTTKWWRPVSWPSSEHPLREELWRSLMLGLARSGGGRGGTGVPPLSHVVGRGDRSRAERRAVRAGRGDHLRATKPRVRRRRAGRRVGCRARRRRWWVATTSCAGWARRSAHRADHVGRGRRGGQDEGGAGGRPRRGRGVFRRGVVRRSGAGERPSGVATAACKALGLPARPASPWRSWSAPSAAGCGA